MPDRPLELRSLQVEPGPERLAGEPEEQPVDLVHAQSLAGHPLPPPGTPGPRATAMLDSAPGEGCKLPGVWSIGEFSERCGLSVKALRSYGGIGLLPPAAIDAVSGYRYYAADQLPRAVLIAAMRRAGVPLAEIAGFLRQPDPVRFEHWAEAIAAESGQRRRALTEARDLWNGGPIMTETFTPGAATHVGGRDRNEDAVLAGDRMVAVADGIGGMPAGQRASRSALEALRAAFETDPTLHGLVAGVRAANSAVVDGGTTLTAVARTVDDGVVLAHVGDSRAYRWRRGQLSRLTEDHTVVAELVAAGDLAPAEAAGHEQRFVLTRAVGVGPHVQVDFGTVDLRPGDRLLLCTDGLHRALDEADIAGHLGDDPQRSADALVAAALRAGTTDNVTAVVLAL